MRGCQYQPKAKLSWCCRPEANDVEDGKGGFIDMHKSCIHSECGCACHVDQENRDHASSTPLTRQCVCNGPRANAQRRAKAERLQAEADAAAAAIARRAARRPRALTVIQGGAGDRPVVDGPRRRARRPGDPR